MSALTALRGEIGDVEAERRLVGAVVTWPEHAPEVLAIVHPDDITDRDAREILRAVAALDARRERVTPETIRAELVGASVWHVVGAAGLGAVIDDGAGDRSIVDVLAQHVRSWAHARGMRLALDRQLSDAPRHARDVAAWLDSTSAAVHAAATGVTSCVAAGIGDLVADALDDHGGPPPGLPSCLPSLSRLLQWRPGELVVVAARPAVGKSSLVLQQALHSALRGVPVLFVSCEMSRAEVAARALSIVSGVDGAATTRRRRFTPDEEVAVAHAQRKLRGAPLSILDASSATLAAVRAEARRIVARHGSIGLIVLDYLQLMTPPERRKGGTREEEVSQLSRGAKVLAGELGACVVGVSQLNRAADGAEPRLAHLRESGALEQDANAVVFLHADTAPQDGDSVVEVQVIVAKNRSGPVGRVPTWMRRATTSFQEIAAPAGQEEDV